MAEESPEHGPTDQGDGEPAHEPTEITYAEYLHPARPRSLRHRPRVKSPVERRSVAQDGPANGENPAYVDWLRSQSMLADANEISQPALRPGHDVAEPVRQPEPPPGRRHRVGVVHRLPAVADHPAGRVVPDRAGRRGAVEGVRRRSGSTPSTPARSSGRAGSRGGSTRPASTATSTASAPRSTRRSAPRTSSGRCAGPRRGTAARSSTTSCPATPARAPTSGSPR